MRVSFTGEAKAELFAAVLYYEEVEPGLGKRMRDEISQLVHAIAERPYLWRLRVGGYYRVNCPVFPYYLAYVIRDDCAIIVAVAHASRKPGYFKDRL